MSMKFAQSSAVYFNYSLQHAIADLGRLGYDGIEIWGGRPHMYRDDLDLQLDEINGLLEEQGMVVCNFIPAQFRYPSQLCSDNEQIRRDSVQYILSAIKNAAKVKSPSVSLCPGMVVFDRDIKKGWEQLRKSMEEIAELNRDYGLDLLIEPAHRYESNLILTVEDGLRMINQLKSDRFGILLDTGHAHVNGEDFAEIVPKCKGIPFHIHIDDNDSSADQHLMPGAGTIDFKILSDALDGIGYEGFVSAELGLAYLMDPGTACGDTLEFLRKAFGNSSPKNK